MEEPRHLRPSGGYRDLLSFQTATLIFDATVAFCDRWVDSRSRTHDQMVQAARSGRQNIAEGSRAAATSSQTELRLVNVARASLEELLLDYEDYLRQHGKPQWSKDDPQALAVRAVARENKTDKSDKSDKTTTDRTHRTDPTDPLTPYHRWLKQDDPMLVANTIICLIHQANYLLDRQISGLERVFVQEGGYSEQLAARRIATRNEQEQSEIAPVCPLCAKPMQRRTARQGANAGSQFWGCSAYPACRGTLPCENERNRSDKSDKSDKTTTDRTNRTYPTAPLPDPFRENKDQP